MKTFLGAAWGQRGTLVAGLLLQAVAASGWAAMPEATAHACPSAAQSRWLPVASETAVLMLLSPRMPWALQEWPRMLQTAQQAGFDVHPMRDPRVPVPEWLAATHRAGLPELDCVPALDRQQAIDLGTLHHAPTSIVAHCGRLHPWPILGVMPDSAWLDLLQQRLAQLKKQPCA